MVQNFKYASSSSLQILHPSILKTHWSAIPPTKRLFPIQILEGICCHPKGVLRVKPGQAVVLVNMNGNSFFSLNSHIYATLFKVALHCVIFIMFYSEVYFFVFCFLYQGRHKLDMPNLTCESYKVTWTPGVDNQWRQNYWLPYCSHRG